MALHKAPDNSIHDDMDGTALHLLPAGCTPVTAEEAEALLPKPSPAAIIEEKKQTVRAIREQVLDRLAGIAGRASRRGDAELAEACDTASDALLDITKDLPDEPSAVELALFSRYQAIAAAAVAQAPTLATAFAKVDA